jgi:hypothetical protein
MRRVIFLFLDGVGLGADDPATNPLAVDAYPTLRRLLDGAAPVLDSGRVTASLAELVPTDAQMGVPGRPQSATGQAAIVTGVNAPLQIGEHYGPRPDARVRTLLDQGTIFSHLADVGARTRFVNAYPQPFFDAVARGKRLLSAIPYAVLAAGQSLPTYENLATGQALSADFTGEGWRTELGYTDAPVYTPSEAGRQIWNLAEDAHFSFFEHWLTDVLGHERALNRAVENFVLFDQVLAGLLEVADMKDTLVIITSDHGNVEDCSHSRHTANPALTLLIGAGRQEFASSLRDLTGFAPAISTWLTVPLPAWIA